MDEIDPIPTADAADLAEQAAQVTDLDDPDASDLYPPPDVRVWDADATDRIDQSIPVPCDDIRCRAGPNRAGRQRKRQ